MKNKDKFTLKEAFEVIAKHMQHLAKHNNLSKSLTENKTGPGQRLGKTKSGKDIFETPKDMAHDDFDQQDHKDAADAHWEAYVKNGDHSHMARHDEHMSQAKSKANK